VAEARCEWCTRKFVRRNGGHRYCSVACRERAKSVAVVAGPARYGAAHRRLRRKLAPQVATGLVACVRCGLPIGANERWELDHRDDGTGYLGAAHQGCNAASGADKARAIALEERYLDDPAKGIYWGPPDEAGGTPRRWSRPWFTWR